MDPTFLLTPVILISVVIFIAWPLIQEGKANLSQEESHLVSAIAEKEAVLMGLKDLEMDFRMGKLSEEDYQNSREELETRALQAIEYVESLEKKKK